MDRRPALPPLALLALAALRPAPAAAAPKHFVVALVDDLGGYNVPWRNPEQKGDDLLQLSMKEGMRLENFYTFKYCSPTRSALMSGRIPAHVNQNNLNNDIEAPSGVDLRFTMLPQKLKLAGYTTSFVGKWWASSCHGPAAAVSATRG